MKWFIASDIHGSAYYAEKMLAAFARESADKMLLLGDILYHGPRNDLPKEYNPKEVISLLNTKKDRILCVRGNCDTEVDQMVLEFPVLADYCVIHDSGVTVYATHGHVYHEENLPPLQKGDVLLHGHTHVPKNAQHEAYRCLNPGSVSIPKEGSHHGYMIFENGVFLWKDMDGNVVEI
ncbi:MAG: phosphodiesterase [Clostridia bacterium]|nr:phosphodiesterase [Clostridia bacterium]